MAETVTIRKKGRRPLKFSKGGLHRSLGVPEGEPIPEGKKAAALRGDYGPKAKRQANFGFRGALAAGRETVAARAAGRGRKRKSNPIPGVSVSGTGGSRPKFSKDQSDPRSEQDRRFNRAGTQPATTAERHTPAPTRERATRMSDAELERRLHKGGMRFRY